MRCTENFEEATHVMTVYDARGTGSHVADFYLVLPDRYCRGAVESYLRRNFPSQANMFSSFRLVKIADYNKAGVC